MKETSIEESLKKAAQQEGLETIALDKETYNAADVATILGVGRQQAIKLLREYHIDMMNVAFPGSKKMAYRIRKNEVLRLLNIIKI